MAQEIITCDNCNQPIKLQKDFGAKQRGKSKSKFRIRRFYCDLCEIGKTVFASGHYDEKVIPEKIKEDIELIHKQEEEARKI